MLTEVSNREEACSRHAAAHGYVTKKLILIGTNQVLEGGLSEISY